MIFSEALENELKSEKVLTENGGVGYKTSKSALVDFNFKMSSYRNLDEQAIESGFADAYNEDALLAVKMLFFAGDIRQGMGERRVFRTCLKWLAKYHQEIAEKVLHLVPEYSRWDIVVDMLNTNIGSTALNLIKTQLEQDKALYLSQQPISLLAKWLPSVNTSSKQSRAKARSLCTRLQMKERNYRKLLSSLRAYLNVVETKISANKWSEVNYDSVPSKANLLYKNAFMRHDETRRSKYLESVQKGEAKINSSAAFPYDIVSKYNRCNAPDATLEEMWKALPDFVKADSSNTIVIADGSGSMTATVGNTNVTRLDVANSLAVYFSERLQGEFKNKYITFSRNPQLVDLSKCDTLFSKLYECKRHDECANTDIEKAFMLILNTAIHNNLEQNEIPQNILVVSDMEFDSRSIYTGSDDWYIGEIEFDNDIKTVFENVSAKYQQYGYQLPKLVFWNVCSTTNAVPLQENKNGVALVSGFSPSIASMVFSQKNNSYDVLLEKLNSERYNAIEKALA